MAQSWRLTIDTTNICNEVAPNSNTRRPAPELGRRSVFPLLVFQWCAHGRSRIRFDGNKWFMGLACDHMTHISESWNIQVLMS
jgi:hypothetical protein